MESVKRIKEIKNMALTDIARAILRVDLNDAELYEYILELNKLTEDMLSNKQKNSKMEV